jgi:hypothetical protein
MVDVTYVEVIHNRVVGLRLSEGSDRVVELAPLFWDFVFEKIAEDDDLFSLVSVDPEIGTIIWPNGAEPRPRRSARRVRARQTSYYQVLDERRTCSPRMPGQRGEETRC